MQFHNFKDFMEMVKEQRQEEMNSGGYLIPEIIERPRSWFEVLKQRYLPYWLKRYWKVKYETIPVRERFLKIVMDKSIVG